MCRFGRCVSTAVAIVTLMAGFGWSASTRPLTLRPGAQAPDFNLPGVDGKKYSLADFADADVLVVIFTSNHCPTAQAYEGRMKKLTAYYKDRGVRAADRRISVDGCG
jgi:hypothetical protein